MKNLKSFKSFNENSNLTDKYKKWSDEQQTSGEKTTTTDSDTNSGTKVTIDYLDDGLRILEIMVNRENDEIKNEIIPLLKDMINNVIIYGFNDEEKKSYFMESIKKLRENIYSRNGDVYNNGDIISTVGKLYNSFLNFYKGGDFEWEGLSYDLVK